MIGGLSDNFCGDSDSPGFIFKHSGFNFLLLSQPTSCINQASILCFYFVLLVLLLVSLIQKSLSKADKTPSRTRGFSKLQIVSAIFNGCLGLLYLCLGAWSLEDKLRKTQTALPLEKWFLALFQGFTWSLVTATTILGREHISKIMLRLLSILPFSLAGFVCVLATSAAVLGKGVSGKTVLDILSLPGAVLLLLCTYKVKKPESVDGNEMIGVDALKTDSDGISETDTARQVSPFAEAGFLSRMSLSWLNPLMKLGSQKTLKEQDIPKLRVAERAESCYLQYLEQLNKQNQANPSSQPSPLKTIILCHWKENLNTGFFAFLKIVSLSAGPLILNSFILISERKEGSKYEGCLLALTLFITKCLESLAQRQWNFGSKLIGLKVRSLLAAIIYKKQSRLSYAGRLMHSGGEIMNYVTVDAQRVGEFSFWFHQIWTTCLQICFSLAILFHAVGLAAFAALAVIILNVLANTPLAKLQRKFQSRLMGAQDDRLKASNEALVNMKVLKLYAWEAHFKNVIESLRKVEYKWLFSLQLRKACNVFLLTASPIMVSAATFGACYFLKVPLHANNVFTFVATLRLIQDPIRSIPNVISALIQAKVAFSRILNFLETPELQCSSISQKQNRGNGTHAVLIKSANFSWEDNSSKPTLTNVNLEIKPGEKVAVSGEVGSGKSTLVAAVFGEVPNTQGTIQVNGRIAYVSQSAWIQSGTIQDNVIFGSPMDNQRYQNTLERCSLVKDLELLPHGDLTEIGNRGVNLSGGQKQRIQLARALYQDADIYLLDDPFSAVDAETAKNLFNEYVMGALSNKTVLLVTHQVDFLPAFHSVLLMSEGKILRAAPYPDLLASSPEFRELVNAHRETAGSENLNEVAAPQKQRSPDGKIKTSVDKQLKAAKGLKGDDLIKNEEREIGDTGLKPYIQYLNQDKAYIYFIFGGLAYLAYVITQIVQNSWMAANVDNHHVSTLRLIVVYLIIGFTSTLFLVMRSLTTVTFGLRSSKSLFSQLLNYLFRAPMSFYDSTPLGRILSRVSSDLNVVDLDVPSGLNNALGATINTYSNLGILALVSWQVLFVSIPMVYLATRLQRYYYASAKDLMRLYGTSKSLVANHLAESVAGAVTVRAFQEEERFFLRNLDLIDTNASPFFHNFAANDWLIQQLEIVSGTVLGSAAFCMALLPSGTFSSGECIEIPNEPNFLQESLLDHQDMLLNQLMPSLQDLLILTWKNTNPSSFAVYVSAVQWIKNQCSLANYIISVERLDQYMHISSEAPEVIEDNRPPPYWPAVGELNICDLQVRYRPEAPLVLQGITCKIAGGHKVGIVGRTGSGKTTLISALFRLVEPVGGKIVVDGIDISKIGLQDLRSRFGIIPQDPTLFNGTIRYNLDPLSQFTDNEIWEVLEKCQLREVIQEKEGSGLDSLVVEDGSNWSMGQRQLFCLGRALLRRCRILVLDEATASIDNATDLILQSIIRTEFADCTVITIAHRIPTVMDCNVVLAMRDGNLVEYDEPAKLMSTEGSLFGQLVKEYWSHLHIAESH